MKGVFVSRGWRLVALGVVALVFAVALSSLSAPAATGVDDYVALGDSFSSGVGTGSYTLSSSCRRGVYAYPWLVAQRPNTSLTFVACSGASTADLLNTQLQAVTAETDVITLTIGGNDIGFADLLVQCTVANCSTALDTTRSTLGTVLAPKLNTVYSTLKAAAPGARVVVLGYPRMFSGAGCFGSFGISSTERTKANQLADALDQLIGSRASAHGFAYKSAITPFTGHAVCSSSAWLNGLNLASTIESYHPNRNGNTLGYAPMVRQALGW